MSKLKSTLFAALCLLLSAAAASGQAKKPEAYLRADAARRADPDHSIDPRAADATRYVEVYMPVPLRKAEYDALKHSATGGSLGVLVLLDEDAGDVEQPQLMTVSPDDCVRDALGAETSCARTHFRFKLPADFDASKSYEVFFGGYPTDTGPVLRYRSVPVGQDFTTTVTTKDFQRKGRLVLEVRFSEALKFDPVTGGLKPNKSLRFATEQDSAAYDAYVRQRMTRVAGWLRGLTPAEVGSIDVLVRPVNELLKPDPNDHVTVNSLGNLVKPDGTIWQPKEANLDTLKVVEIAVVPKPGVPVQFVLGHLKTNRHLPSDEFHVKLKLPIAAAPLELPAELVKTGLPGGFVVEEPKAGDTGEAGARLVEHDLDIVGSFSSSVVEKEKKSPDPAVTDPVKVRERETRATLDGRVAPFGISSSLRGVKVHGAGGPVEKQRTSASYLLTTPAFLDFKVSTGKITDDTLSLNRVVVGSQLEYQYFYNNRLNPTFFRLIGRGSNASDRDFKQAEYKGTFEFRPVFGPLNHPLASIQTAQSHVIFDDDNAQTPLTFISAERGGYEFVPFFGGEIGRTWARRNPSAAVKPSDTVKRLYVGLDITLNPFKRTTVTLNDTFYFRFESEDDRRENYFLGSVDFRLSRFGGGRAAHSIYFSFERGQAPPFNDPGVNALKFGYRVRADRIFSSGVR